MMRGVEGVRKSRVDWPKGWVRVRVTMLRL